MEVLIYPLRHGIPIIKSLVPELVILEPRKTIACLLLFLQLCFCGILLRMFWETFEYSLKTFSAAFFVLTSSFAVRCFYNKYKIAKYNEESILRDVLLFILR